MPKKGANINLKGYDDLFSTEESRAEAQQERVQEISLSDLHPFEGHPFRVVDDEDIDTSLPCEQRIKNFVEQIGNPYCYLDGDVVVSLGFSDTGVCLKDQLKALASNIG